MGIERPDALDDPLADPLREPGRVVGIDSHVLVHVEDDHPVPRDLVGTSDTRASVNSSCELPVANIAFATPRFSPRHRIASPASSAAASANAAD